MEKYWFKIISTSKNVSGIIISVNIYFFVIIYISKNKYVRFEIPLHMLYSSQFPTEQASEMKWSMHPHETP